MSRRPSMRMCVIAVLSLVGLFASLLTGPMAAASPDPRPVAQPQKIALDLAEAFAADDTQDYWVLVAGSADTSAGRQIEDHAEQGWYVYERLREFADEAQAPVRALLDERGADSEPFWIVNAVWVNDGTSALATELTALAQVERIIAPVGYELVEPVERTAGDNAPNAVEWGIENINADDVWDQYGARGEGIVVANVDTGVQYDHPALVEQYRGNNGDGTFDHNYNWFDTTGSLCPDAPCDDNGHGTHTMGTMVGDDGAGNQIGVAPEAEWITVNGCHTCSDDDLFEGMEWITAPTDLDGENADPAMRPHIVNNSWGTISPSDDPFGEEIQQVWADSGIFGSWSNGNDGPGCSTSGSPGSRIINYSVGAHDIDDDIATFSARGPGQDGEIKPNISAPGVDVRSSAPGGDYASMSGTSMAAPHIGGAVALLWSAKPVMARAIEDTRALLDDTALDTQDPFNTCGGTLDDNNVWGEGRLDALALVDAAPTDPTGVLTGTVTDDETGDPVAGAGISVTGPLERETSTDENGEYSLTLSTGSYDVTAELFGYETQTQSAEVSVDSDATVDFALTPIDTWVLIGAVRDRATGEYLVGATVEIEGTPLTTTTNHRGRYRFESVPAGTYDITASSGACHKSRTKSAVIDGEWPRRTMFKGDERKRFRLGPVTDDFGYACVLQPASYVEGDTLLPISGHDVHLSVDLPFPFPFYGQTYETAHLSDDGYLNFLMPYTDSFNTAIPGPSDPNAAVYPFWNNLEITPAGGVYTGIIGTAPDRGFVIEYRNVDIRHYGLQVDFETILWENGDITFVYRNLDADPLEHGAQATVGIENADGTDARQFSFYEASLSNEQQIHFRRPPEDGPTDPTGVLTGIVTDEETGDPIAGATVSVSPTEFEATTDENGQYWLTLSVGSRDATASAFGYQTQSRPAEITEDATTTVDFALPVVTAYFSVSGTVTDATRGEPVADATVMIDGTPLAPETTDGNGFYTFESVPAGTYEITAAAGRCTDDLTRTVTVDGDETLDFGLPQLVDDFGYTCALQPANYIEGDTLLPQRYPGAPTTVDLPFPVAFYGQNYQTVHTSNHGYLNFLALDSFYINTGLPNPPDPNAAVYAFWDDFLLSLESVSVYTGVIGAAPERGFIIEYRNAKPYDTDLTVDFETILWENGDITFAYRNLDADPRARGAEATVGIENADGTDALELAFNEAVLTNEEQIHVMFPPAAGGFVRGTVTDANDGQPIAGAQVSATTSEGEVVAEITTATNGYYLMFLEPGTYTIVAVTPRYPSGSEDISIVAGETEIVDLVLETATIDLTPPSLQFVVPEGQVGQDEVTIENDGTQPLEWEILETGQGLREFTPEQGALRADGADRSGVDPNAMTSRDYWSEEQLATPPTDPSDVGDVLAEWPATGLTSPWGVGYDGDVWISDSVEVVNQQYGVDGAAGVQHPADWAEAWNGDMAFEERSGSMCQLNVGGDNGIYCWDPVDGEVDYWLTGSPWSDISQRGLAYNSIDDVFYTGGWNDGVIYTVAGQSHPTPGETLSECGPEDNDIAGLAYNPTYDVLWMATNSPTDTIYQLTPDDCATISSMADPGRFSNSGAGLSLDSSGNLWATDQAEGVVRLVESGVPAESDVPWLSVEPVSGTTQPGGLDRVQVQVDATGLVPGSTYEALIVVSSTAGRTPIVTIPVELVVPRVTPASTGAAKPTASTATMTPGSRTSLAQMAREAGPGPAHHTVARRLE